MPRFVLKNCVDDRSALQLSKALTCKNILNQQAVAIAARSSIKATEFAAQHQIPQVYNSYSDLIHSSDIDVIYIGTIADCHVQWTKEALLAGKAVVCEKPMALSAREVGEVIGLARERNVFLM